MTPNEAQALHDFFDYDVIVSGGKAHVYMGDVLLWTKDLA